MINDGMQEFYVHFHGPNESKFSFVLSLLLVWCFFVNCFGWKKIGCYCGYVLINPILTSVVLDLDLVGNIKILIELVILSPCNSFFLSCVDCSVCILQNYCTKQFIYVFLLISPSSYCCFLSLNRTTIFYQKRWRCFFFFYGLVFRY